MVAERVDERITCRVAFPEWVERFYEPLLVTAQRIAPWATVEAREDAVHTALERALVRWEQIHSEEWNFCVAVLRHDLRDTARKEVRRRGPWLAAIARQSCRDGRDVADAVPAVLDVRRALRTLPDRQREAVTLVDLLDLDVSAAAEHMGLSETQVKGLLQRGRSGLRLALATSLSAVAAFIARVRRVVAPTPVVAAANSVAVVAALCVAVFPGPTVTLPHASALMTADSGPQAVAREARRLQRPTTAFPSPATGGNASATPRDQADEEHDGGRSIPSPPDPPVSACLDKREPECNDEVEGDEVCVPMEDYAYPCAKSEARFICDLMPSVPGVTCTRPAAPPL